MLELFGLFNLFNFAVPAGFKILSNLTANILTTILDMLTNVDLSGVIKAIETLTPYLKAGLYILPAETIGQIFSIIVTLWSLRLIVKTIKLLWDLLPVL